MATTRQHLGDLIVNFFLFVSLQKLRVSKFVTDRSKVVVCCGSLLSVLVSECR